MTDASDETGHDIEQHREATAAEFRVLESVDADVSPELASSVQATINLIKSIAHDYGLLTEDDERAALGLAPGDTLAGFRRPLPRPGPVPGVPFRART